MASYDLFSPSFKACPHATFADMRRDAPIYAHRDPNGRTIWYVTRYEDTVAIMRDPRFIKDASKLTAKASGRPTLAQAINQNMLFADPPDHTRLRSIVNQAFTPRRVERMADAIQATCDHLIDTFCNDDQADLIAQYALPLAVIIISDLLGIPPTDRDQVAAWSQSIISPGGRKLKASERKRQMRSFVDYLNATFDQRRSDPQDDLISALVQAEEGGERLDNLELSSMVALLLVTGHETTVNLIGNGVLTLLQHPQQLDQLKADPSLIDSAVEELLRFDGPVETSTTRWVGEDLSFKGHHMQRGDIMRVVITSANRDPAMFDAPDQLDLTRSHNRHLQFGHGIHYCLGAPLARLEGKIGILTLFNRLEGLRMVDSAEIQWRSGVLFRGLQSLHLTWGADHRHKPTP